MNSKHAFTLLELLTVVAVIAILASIAVPNFLEAQTRSKIALVRSDQAVLTVAIRAYYTDYRVFPPNNQESAAFFRSCAKVGAMSTGEEPNPARPQGPIPAFDEARYDLNILSSPLAYFTTQMPVDAFSAGSYRRDKKPYNYINLADAWRGVAKQESGRAVPRYVLISYGPEQDTEAMFTKTIANPVKGPWIDYDPTNGTISGGDIYNFGD